MRTAPEDKRASLICVRVALMYMMRRNCHMLQQHPSSDFGTKRWKNHIRFIQAIGNNLHGAGINEKSESWKIIMARVCASCSRGLEERLELLDPVLVGIEFLLNGDLPSDAEWTGEQSVLEDLQQWWLKNRPYG